MHGPGHPGAIAFVVAGLLPFGRGWGGADPRVRVNQRMHQ